jgi:hypothetical protein
MLMTRILLSLALAVSPAASVLAQDQGRPPGQVAARAFAAAPSPLAFTIEPGENSDENVALAGRLAREAAARGIDVRQEAGGLVLRFDTEIRTPSAAPRQSFSREGGNLSGQGAGAPDLPGSRDEVTNMLSSGGDGVIGGRPLSGANYTRFLRYVINATLDDRATGRRIWQGHVSYDTSESDRAAMFVALAPVLAEQIGKSVQERAFRLD